MHELSLTQSVVEAVLERTAGRQVVSVRVRVGKLAGVVPDAMRFCFDLATDGTPLAGATLVIDDVAGEADCRTCGTRFTLPDPILLCPCGSADVNVVAGRELQIAAVEMAA